MVYAQATSVSEDRSRSEIEKMLVRAGASRVGCITDIGARKAMIGFTLRNLNIQMQIPLPAADERRFTHGGRNGWQKRPEHKAQEAFQGECRRRWRSLSLALKAKLVAIEDKITTFEQEFMPYVVMADGQTIGEKLTPHLLAAEKAGGLVPAGLLGPAPSQGATAA